MPRVVSFIVLLAIVLLIGSMFFQVMVQFIVPLFLAAVLVVIFKPLHLWVLEKCAYRIKMSAAVTTFLIVLIVLIPLAAMLVRAISEGADHYAAFMKSQSTEEETVQEADPTETMPEGDEEDTDEGTEEGTEENTEEEEQNQEADSSTAEQDSLLPLFSVIDNVVLKVNELLAEINLPTFPVEEVRNFVGDMVSQVAAPLALGGVKVLFSTIFSLVIMVLTLYYFFADGPNMIIGLMKLSPLDDEYEQELLDKFADVSRAVVVAVLLSAIVQGLLAGVGYYFAGIEDIFFLTVATCFLAMVPFVGAAAIWVPICLYLFFHTSEALPDGRPIAATVLAVYCMTVVSMIDNLIKPLVLHGQSNLHPLLALLSVIGGIQTLGPIGILVGPMLVAFLQALLNMLNKELHLLGKESDETGKPVVFATGAEDKSEDASKPVMPTPASQPQRKNRRRKKK